jgi:hypothetical protein
MSKELTAKIDDLLMLAEKANKPPFVVNFDGGFIQTDDPWALRVCQFWDKFEEDYWNCNNNMEYLAAAANLAPDLARENAELRVELEAARIEIRDLKAALENDRLNIQNGISVLDDERKLTAEFRAAIRLMWPAFATVMSFIEHVGYHDLAVLGKQVEAAQRTPNLMDLIDVITEVAK